jgi:hypothetical protein
LVADASMIARFGLGRRDEDQLEDAPALVFVGELALLGRFEFLEQDLSRELE